MFNNLLCLLKINVNPYFKLSVPFQVLGSWLHLKEISLGLGLTFTSNLDWNLAVMLQMQ